MDEVRKDVDMVYGLVDVFEFWENKVTYFYRHHFRFFCKIDMFLKHENHLGIYPGFRVMTTRTNTLRTTGAQRELL